MAHVLEESLPLSGTELVTYFWPVEGWWGVTPMIMLGYCCCSVPKLCPTLCDPMDCSPPGSSVLGISQARILEQVASSFSRRSSRLRDWTRISCLAGRLFTTEPLGKPCCYCNTLPLNIHTAGSLSSFTSLLRRIRLSQF